MAKDEEIMIARSGTIEETKTRMSHKDIVQGMRALRQVVKPGKMSIREMIREGRRF